MPATLYVVSTPIGNLDDITLRALNTLKSVSLIAAEDTRRTSKLLHHFGITTPTTSLHEHNERQKIPHLIEKLVAGADIALVSDAGTPLVADPGQRLIAAAIAADCAIVPIPGPSAVLTALTISGFPADSFVFAGFAPSRSNDRNKWLAGLVEERRTIVFFETPHRIQKTLAELATYFGNRPIVVGRELTKLHEEVIRGTADAIGQMPVKTKGEFTLVLGPVPADFDVAQPVEEKDVVDRFYQLTNHGLGRRPALAQTAREFGLSTNNVYAAVERFKHLRPS